MYWSEPVATGFKVCQKSLCRLCQRYPAFEEVSGMLDHFLHVGLPCLPKMSPNSRKSTDKSSKTSLEAQICAAYVFLKVSTNGENRFCEVFSGKIEIFRPSPYRQTVYKKRASIPETSPNSGYLLAGLHRRIWHTLNPVSAGCDRYMKLCTLHPAGFAVHKERGKFEKSHEKFS